MNYKSKIKKSFTLQQEQADCGVACLLSIVRYHNGDSSIEYLRTLSGTDRVGTTMLGLSQAATALGLNVEGLVAGECADLKTLNHPAILHVVNDSGYEHFVVYYQSHEDAYVIGDPAKGVKTITNDDLNRMWTSKRLMQINVGEDFISSKFNSSKKRRWFLAQLTSDAPMLITAVFLGVVVAVTNLSTAMFLQRLIDKILPSKNANQLTLGLVLLLLVMLVKSGLNAIRSALLNKQGVEFNARIANEFYDKLLQLPQSFFDTRKTGELVTRLNDTRRIQQTLSFITSNVIIDALTAIVTLGYLLTTAPTIALIALGSIPLYFGIAWFFNDNIELFQQDIMANSAVTENNYIETIQGIEAIKINNKEEGFVKKNKGIYKLLQNSIFGLRRLTIKISFLFETTNTVLLVSIISSGTFLFLGGKISLGEMISSISIAGSFTPAIMALSIANIQVQEAKVAFNRMFEFANLPTEQNLAGQSAESRMDSPTLLNPGSILINRLSFGFPGRRPLFQDMSFAIAKGEITLLMGESGKGKSTLLQLIQRLYLPLSGEMTVDGVSLSDIPSRQWRECIGVVPQFPKIFNTTLLSNISLDMENQQEEQVLKFCKENGFDAFFSGFSDGYQTIVGEGGVNLSGGQKQLLALARALYKQPQFLLLDEATSAMDTYMEQFVFNLIHRYKPTTGIFMVTHKINELLNVDRIYKLEQGNFATVPFNVKAKAALA